MSMTFKTLSLSSLLHNVFQLAPRDFIEHLMFNNEIRPYAERALLKVLLYEHIADELPAITADEPAAFWDRMRYRLGYIEASRTMEFLEGIDVSMVELSEAINTHLRAEKFVDQFIGTLLSDESRRNAVLWELLLDLSLRERIICAAGREYMASDNGEEPDENIRVAVHTHLMLKHDYAPWSHLLKKLVRGWGMTQERVDRFVNVLAKAHWRIRKGNAGVQSQKD